MKSEIFFINIGVHIRALGLAVKLASEWERLSKAGQQNSGSSARLRDLERGHLPPEYAAGLQMVDWPGRSQVIEDDLLVGEGEGDSTTSTREAEGSRLSFYIDGAHTPESMETCAAWFADQCSHVNNAGEAEERWGDESLCLSALTGECVDRYYQALYRFLYLLIHTSMLLHSLATPNYPMCVISCFSIPQARQRPIHAA